MSDNNETYDPRDLLSQPLSDFPDMPDLPAGKHFYGKLLGVKADRSTVKKTPLFDFAVRLTDPGEDVTEAEKAAIASSGCGLGDYTCGAKFYITPAAMTMFRRFLISLGFSESLSFKEQLSLDKDCNPTSETIDKIRGLDVIIKTPLPAGDNKRVFLNNVDTISGVKSR
jgi:hypothetical protein